MKPNVLIHRYAKAFLELAIQNDVVDKVLDDLLLLNTVLKGNKELEILLHQPFVSKTHKKNIMNKILNDKVESITLNLINLLIDKNRDEIIDDIYEKYYELYLDYKKIAVVTVTSAVVIDEQTTNRIIDILRHKIVGKDTIQIKKVIDKNIIGGFKVAYMDYEYDASVVSTLKRLHSVFEENLFVKGF